MKTLVISIISVMLLTLCTAGISNAQQKGHEPGKDMKGMMQHKNEMVKKLNLTDQQKAKIKELRTAFQKNMIDLRADLQKSKIDLKALKSKDNLNRDEVIAAVGKVNSSRDAVSLAVANHLLDVYQVFTPEQQKIWKESAHSRHMWGRRGHMGFGRRGHQGFGKECHQGFGGKGDHKGFDGGKGDQKNPDGGKN
jgi:Spy/CpxP family protein refolding chaperone